MSYMNERSFETEPQLPEPEPTQYELNIGPELSALVEIDQVPESYFDRRHEIMDKPAEAPQEDIKPMVPLTEVLAKYEVKTPQKQVKQPLPNAQEPFLRQVFKRTLPKKYLYTGIVPGLIIATILLIVINK